jgi:hypothetical protein
LCLDHDALEFIRIVNVQVQFSRQVAMIEDGFPIHYAINQERGILLKLHPHCNTLGLCLSRIVRTAPVYVTLTRGNARTFKCGCRWPKADLRLSLTLTIVRNVPAFQCPFALFMLRQMRLLPTSGLGVKSCFLKLTARDL